jgi:TRAP-type C4-dicarboxylate transport system permease small subunit
MSPSKHIIRISGWLAMGCAALILSLTLYEIVMRSLGAPTTWVLDVSSYLLCLMIGTAFPLITASNGHVAITLLSDNLREPLRGRIHRGVDFCCASLCLVAAYLCATVVLAQYSQGITTLSGVVMPKWILTAIVLYGFGASGTIHGLNGLFGRPSHEKPAEVL